MRDQLDCAASDLQYQSTPALVREIARRRTLLRQVHSLHAEKSSRPLLGTGVLTRKALGARTGFETTAGPRRSSADLAPSFRSPEAW